MDVLKEILLKEVEKQQLIKAFQDRVWNGKDYSSNQKVNEILLELAYDLDYYQPKESFRKQSPSYYGQERLEKELSEAINRIKDIEESPIGQDS